MFALHINIPLSADSFSDCGGTPLALPAAGSGSRLSRREAEAVYPHPLGSLFLSSHDVPTRRERRDRRGDDGTVVPHHLPRAALRKHGPDCAFPSPPDRRQRTVTPETSVDANWICGGSKRTSEGVRASPERWKAFARLATLSLPERPEVKSTTHLICGNVRFATMLNTCRPDPPMDSHRTC